MILPKNSQDEGKVKKKMNKGVLKQDLKIVYLYYFFIFVCMFVFMFVCFQKRIQGLAQRGGRGGGSRSFFFPFSTFFCKI